MTTLVQMAAGQRVVNYHLVRHHSHLAYIIELEVGGFPLTIMLNIICIAVIASPQLPHKTQSAVRCQREKGLFRPTNNTSILAHVEGGRQNGRH